MECCGSKGSRHKNGCSTLAPETPTEPTVPTEPVVPVEPVAPTEPSADDVAQELAQESNDEAVEAKDAVAPVKQSQALDLSGMTDEQMSALQDAINIAKGGGKEVKKSRKTIITLRRLEGKIITNFTNAYKKSIFDEEQQRKVVRHHIRVRYDGDESKEPLNEVMYRDFNSAERVRCELISTASKAWSKDLGEVFSAEEKRNVPMVVNYIDRIHTLKVPGREENLTISAKLVN